MKKLVIDELRKRACVAGKQKTWVVDLTDDQLYELFKRLRKGQKAKPIARFIRKEWGVKPNSSVHSLSQGILKFQKRIQSLIDTEPLEKGQYLQPVSHDLVHEEDLGSLERNVLIAKRLRDRIDRLIKEEKENGIPFPYLSREVQALTSLEKMIVKQKEWELKHPGGDPVELREIQRKDRKIESLFDTYMEKTTKEQRDMTLKIMEILVENIEEMSVPLVKDEDGDWIIIESENGHS